MLTAASAVLSSGNASAQPLVRRWNVAANGAWNTNTNWGPALVPNGANIEAGFPSQPNFFGPINVTLDIPVTLNRMVFNSNSAYTITPQGNQTITLTTFNDNGTTRQPRLVVLAGNTRNQTVAAPIVLDIANKSDLSVQVAGTNPTIPRLTLSGVISSAAGRTNGLSKTGPGALALSAANTYTGDTSIHTGNVIATVNGALGPGAPMGGRSGSPVGPVSHSD